MIKKIDKLVLDAFFGPFILTTCVVTFILLMHFMLGYLDDFVGKDLGILVFAKLMFYFAANILPVGMPLAVLLASLMTYGNLGEHFELTAIKASGISLIRTLRSLFVFAILLTIGDFLFQDYVVPRANLKAFSLLYDIRQKKPTLDFKEGSFYNGLPGYSVKVTKKTGDGKSLKGVIIYDHTAGRGNTQIVIADSGRMQLVQDDRYLELYLYTGNSYSEVQDNNGAPAENYLRQEFKELKFLFSLESFSMSRTKEELFSSHRVMRDVFELSNDIDSLNRESARVRSSVKANIVNLYNYHQKDNILLGSSKPVDLSRLKPVEANKEKTAQILAQATNNARSVKSYLYSFVERVNYIEKDSREFAIEMDLKFTQAIACVIMFLIGAPLGAIIKKGGLGLPILISVIFFVIYYVLCMAGKMWAKEGVMEVHTAMWMANVVLLPIGLFLLRQAKNDSRILETDYFAVLIDKLKQKFKNFRKKKKAKIKPLEV